MKWLIDIHQIPETDVRLLWKEHKTLFDKFWAVTNIGELYSQEDYIQLAEEGVRQCWVGSNNGEIHCIGFSFLAVYPQSKIADVDVLVSYESLNIDWDRVIGQHIEPWAKDNGCGAVYINGRKGWLKALNGYQEVGRTVRKLL